MTHVICIFRVRLIVLFLNKSCLGFALSIYASPRIAQPQRRNHVQMAVYSLADESKFVEITLCQEVLPDHMWNFLPSSGIH